MRHFVLAVKDRAIDAFLKPWYAPSENAGIRAFKDEVKREESEMRKHPEDYDLYELGIWDDHTGKFQEANDGPQLLIRGQDC